VQPWRPLPNLSFDDAKAAVAGIQRAVAASTHRFAKHDWHFTMLRKLKHKWKNWRRKLLAPANAWLQSLKRSAQKIVVKALAEHRMSNLGSAQAQLGGQTSSTPDRLLLGLLKAGLRKPPASHVTPFQVTSVGGNRLLAAHPLAGFMYLSTDDVDVIPHVALGRYQDRQTTAIEHEILPGDRVLHLGAELGFHTLSLAHIVGEKGQVLAVEWNPDRYRLLELNVRAHGLNLRVKCADNPMIEGSLREFLRQHNFEPTAVLLAESVAVPDACLADLLELIRKDSSLRVFAGARRLTTDTLSDWLHSQRGCETAALARAA
jgi:precorrin-6B methylase 2